MTPEEIAANDKLLLADMGTNVSTSEEEPETVEDADPVDTEEDTEIEDTTEDSQEEAVQPEKKLKGVPKLLHERNLAKKQAQIEAQEKSEWKRKAIETEEKLSTLKSKLGIDQETDIEYLDLLSQKRIAESTERLEFFAENPEARAYKAQLADLIEEYPRMSYDEAYTFYLARNNPKALLDEQVRNRVESRHLGTPRIPPKPASKPAPKYDMDELSSKIASGEVVL